MLSAFPAFSPFESGWDFSDSSFLILPDVEPVTSNSCSDTQNLRHSDEPNRHDLKTGSNNLKNKRSGSNESSELGCVLDERKRRRMISNRESARRSRMRKQRHLENLRSQANRFKVENREKLNRVRVAVQETQLIRDENSRLRTEAVILRQRLWDLRQVLLVRQLQQHYPMH